MAWEVNEGAVDAVVGEKLLPRNIWAVEREIVKTSSAK